MKLILLPGMDGTGELFSEFVSALPERSDAIRMLYPQERAVSWPKFEYLLRAVCPNQPYILIAESFSTPLAVRHAASNPPNLKGVVLIAGFITSPWRGWRRGLALLAAPIAFRLPLTDFAVRRWLAGEDATDSLVAAVKAAIASVEPGVLSARLRLILKCDVRELANQVNVPLLYIRGTRDRLKPRRP